MITCPRCHHLNQDGVRACELCSAAITASGSLPAKGAATAVAHLKGVSGMANSDSSSSNPPAGGDGPTGLAKLLQDALSSETEDSPEPAHTPPKRMNTLQNTPGISVGSQRDPKNTPAPGLSGFLLDALKDKAPGGEDPGQLDWSQKADISAEARGGSVICHSCGASNPEGMYFCVHCGANLDGGAVDPVGEEVTCSSCGATNPADNKFCGSCGFPVAAKPGEGDWRGDEEESEPERTASPWDIRLVSINEDGSDGVEIPLNYLQTIIGRSGDTRFPTDAFLSPKHACLAIEDGDLYIEDLYSLNGTFVKIRDEVVLSPGDLFLMGRQVLRFERFEQTITPKARSSDGTRYMGSPPPGGQHKLLQIGIGGVVQNVYCIPETGAVLGREQGEIIFPRDKFMSGRHAQIYPREDGRYCLVDLNSSNGTWIKIWEKAKLDGNDHIFLGQQLFRVELNTASA